MMLAGLGLSVDFGEGKFPLLLGVASLPAWDYLSRKTVFRNAMGAFRWSLNFCISPVVTVFLIRDFLGGFH